MAQYWWCDKFQKTLLHGSKIQAGCACVSTSKPKVIYTNLQYKKNCWRESLHSLQQERADDT